METPGTQLSEYERLLETKWEDALKKKKLNLQDILMKQLPTDASYGNIYVLYHKQFAENPKDFYNKKGTPKEDNDSFEEELSVFKNFSDVKITEDNVLFYVDIENESIKETLEPSSAEFREEELEEEITQGAHPIVLNVFPICRKHVLMALFSEQGLPQLLSDELISLILDMFRISGNKDLKIGYNSMGADCWVNHLHFHLLSSDFLPDSRFPVELAARKKVYHTSLKHKNSEEINLLTVGVIFEETVDYPLNILVLKPDMTDSTNSIEDAHESLAHVAGVFVNHMVEKNIPHNMLISDEGLTFYIIPRKFDISVDENTYYSGWSDLTGLIKCVDETIFEQTNEAEKVESFINSNLGIGKKNFDALIKGIVEKFDNEYVAIK